MMQEIRQILCNSPLRATIIKIIIYCHAKTLGERRRRLGSGPEVEVFAAKNFTLGPDPGASLWGQTRSYLVMARMKVARDMSMEVMVKKMLVEELKKALRASDFLGST